MTRFIECAKLKKQAEGLAAQPYPGELGKKIYAEISQEAWQMWLTHQTMLINEYRLSMLDPKAREFLAREMELFLFGSGSEKPTGYVPP
jgi:Fe-S cluster biosynthesis and repair protein YggX